MQSAKSKCVSPNDILDALAQKVQSKKLHCNGIIPRKVILKFPTEVPYNAKKVSYVRLT